MVDEGFVIDESNPQALVDYISTDKEKTKVKWTSASSIKPKGYIPYAVDIINKTPTQKDWAEVYFLSIISVFCKGIRINDQLGDNYSLVIWPMLSGPSRDGKKTASCNSIRFILKNTSKLLEMDFFAPDDFTGEALIEYLSRRITYKEDDEGHVKKAISHTEGDGDVVYPYLFFFHSELGGWLLANNGLSYQSGMPSRLCRLYDNEDLKRITNKNGQHDATDPYLVMAGCTTPETLCKIFTVDDTFFTQGYGNRIVYIYMDKIEREYPHGILKKKVKNTETNEGLSKFLARLAKIEGRELEFTPQAETIFEKYVWDKANEADRIKELYPTKSYYQYISTLFSFALKFSGLHCVNRECYKTKITNSIIDCMVTAQDLLYAIGLTERVQENFMKIMEAQKNSLIQKKIESASDKKLLIVEFIRNGKGKIATGPELTKHFGFETKYQLDSIMEIIESESDVYKFDEKDIEKLKAKFPGVCELHNIDGTVKKIWGININKNKPITP